MGIYKNLFIWILIIDKYNLWWQKSEQWKHTHTHILFFEERAMNFLVLWIAKWAYTFSKTHRTAHSKVCTCIHTHTHTHTHTHICDFSCHHRQYISQLVRVTPTVETNSLKRHKDWTQWKLTVFRYTGLFLCLWETLFYAVIHRPRFLLFCICWLSPSTTL